MASSQVPLFYRFIFLWYEPLSAAFGVWLTLGNPDNYLSQYFPISTATWDHQYDFWFSQMAAALFYVSTSQAILFRYTNDIGVWKVLNGCLAGWDVILLYSYWVAFTAQGRESPAEWRSEEWARCILTLGLGMCRVAFAAGVGLKQAKTIDKKN